MELSCYCKEIEKNVKAIRIKKYIKDGNNNFQNNYRVLITDCMQKECKNYKGCKISKFDNLE